MTTKVWDDFAAADKFFADLDREMRTNTVEEIATDGATIWWKYIRKDMRSGKSGRKYSHLPKQSSAPGESPAIQSRKLYRSIRRYNYTAQNGRSTSLVSSDDPNARRQEYGTDQQAPRPFMRPAVDNNLAKVERRARWLIRRAVRKV